MRIPFTQRHRRLHIVRRRRRFKRSHDLWTHDCFSGEGRFNLCFNDVCTCTDFLEIFFLTLILSEGICPLWCVPVCLLLMAIYHFIFKIILFFEDREATSSFRSMSFLLMNFRSIADKYWMILFSSTSQKRNDPC